MSTRITLECAAPLLEDLIDAIAVDDLRIDASGAGLIPGIYRFHREGVSTRFTEVTVAEASVKVRLFSMASPEDVAVAMRIVAEIAALGGLAKADAEMMGVVPIADIVAYHDLVWADHQAQSGLRVLRSMIEDGRGPMEISGPRRGYFVGPRVLAELDAGGPPETAHVRIQSAIRHAQWLPVRTAGTFASQREDGTETKLAVWLGEEVVFPAVPYAAVSVEHEGGARDVVLIDSSHVPGLAGDRWSYIDERQGHLRDFGEDWPAIVDAARAFATQL